MTNSLSLPDKALDNIINSALVEDVSHGDITSEVLVPPELSGKASVLVKEAGVLAGIDVAVRTFHQVDPLLKIETLIEDGHAIKPGDIIATITGSVASILKAERTALNFLQRLSGIASLTALYVTKTRGGKACITDTRKTTPGLRLLEKYAVRMGGGRNHRMHLGDAILIKDTHLAALRALGMSLKDMVAQAKQNAPQGTTVEVEVANVPEAMAAIEGGADIIMLDNMSPEEMKRAVTLIGGQAQVEASGGITLENILQVATAGVDIISIGALTHSVRALDISLELEPQTLKLL